MGRGRFYFGQVSALVLVLILSFAKADDWSWGGVRVSVDGSTIYAYEYRNGGWVFRSDDYGKTFHFLEDDNDLGYWGTGGINADGTTILLGSTNAGGVIESLDSGESWHDLKLLPSYPEVHTYATIVMNDDGTEKYTSVSNSGPVWRTKGGDKWERCHIPDKLPRNAITTISSQAMDISKDGKNVYAADYNTNSEILASYDHGDTWSSIQVCNESLKLYPYSLAVGKDDQSTMVVGFSDFEMTGGGLFVSTDAGKSFKDVTAQTQSMAFDTVSMSGDGKYILAGSNNLWASDESPPDKQGHLFLSTDRGSTWKKIEFPEQTYKGFFDSSMSRDGKVMVTIGSNDDHIYMFISNDYGQTWANANDRCIWRKSE